MKIPSWIRSFNRSQSRALIFLLSVELMFLLTPGRKHPAALPDWQMAMDTLHYAPPVALREKAEAAFASQKSFQKADVRPSVSQRLPNKPLRKSVYHKIDINAADSLEWQQFRGIGKVLSSRIVRFRGKLGGFAEIAQVGETWGLADSVFQHIRPHLFIGEAHKKLPVNEASIGELVRHPYIDYDLAVQIVRSREKRGLFSGASDLLERLAEKSEQIKRVLPYLNWGANSPEVLNPVTDPG